MGVTELDYLFGILARARVLDRRRDLGTDSRDLPKLGQGCSQGLGGGTKTAKQTPHGAYPNSIDEGELEESIWVAVGTLDQFVPTDFVFELVFGRTV